ncbi:hypothetical protein [Neptunitalea lumnitzerae]|uniref:Lipoprotein n=1 Tax=Neptunitalea lumnitzerae TaxID=2965509 RepID=A0ABQ5MH40_9FLAO|nr:hypothetical protein [Neptunitalea sp. Y10]GLB48735.1 hypothetical protein Y10_11030 [Neptunitalea sp. Y10]
MRCLYVILVWVLTLSCSSVYKTTEVEVNSSIQLSPPFTNQGEQEDYWAQELFKKEYTKKQYSKFVGEITNTGNKIRFGKFQFVELFDSNSDYNMIFEKGLFYPDILNVISLNIGSLEELKFLSDNPKVKRFRFWLYRPNMANPQVYVFELTNYKATEKTDWKSFIKDAQLTFVKDGWIIL